jgi:hypothetical protein
MLLPAFSQGHGAAYAQAAQAFTFDGEIALWSVSIKPDKTADFEQIMSRVREALMKSEKPERKQQAAGWKVIKGAMPLKDGSIVYTHVIHPVVKGADYTIMSILYEANPDPMEQRKLFEQYRGAFNANLGASAGTVAVDLAKQ